jgi:lysozyme family protein
MQKREDVPLAEQFKRVHRAQAHCAMHLYQLRHDVLSSGAFKGYNQRWANLTNWLRQTGQKLEAEQQKQQAAQMEEMRNPRPKVKDAEVMLTEKLRRDLEAQKAEAEERRAEEKHLAEMRRLAERNAMGGKS